MASNCVQLDIADGVATVTLNQPEVRNALTPELRVAFREVIAGLEGNDAALRGDPRRRRPFPGWRRYPRNGRPSRLRPGHTPGNHSRSGIHMLHLPLFAIRRMGKPVVASIRGAAAGFGIGLVASCDLAIAADDAVFTLAYCHIGASPDGGSSISSGARWA